MSFGQEFTFKVRAERICTFTRQVSNSSEWSDLHGVASAGEKLLPGSAEKGISLGWARRTSLARMVTHVVLFKFDRMDDAQQAVQRLLSMRGRVPSMLEVEAGIDFTRSARSFEVGLVTRHNTRSDLEAYQVDPVHQEVAQFIRAHSSGAAAVDFES